MPVGFVQALNVDNLWQEKRFYLFVSGFSVREFDAFINGYKLKSNKNNMTLEFNRICIGFAHRR